MAVDKWAEAGAKKFFKRLAWWPGGRYNIRQIRHIAKAVPNVTDRGPCFRASNIEISCLEMCNFTLNFKTVQRTDT